MRKPSPKQQRLDELIPSIRKLLATCPQFTIEPAAGPMCCIDYNHGRLTIAYLAHAERIDGRLRATAPCSLDVRHDGEIVLKLRWKDGRRKIIIYEPDRWEGALEFFARNVACSAANHA